VFFNIDLFVSIRERRRKLRVVVCIRFALVVMMQGLFFSSLACFLGLSKYCAKWDIFALNNERDSLLTTQILSLSLSLFYLKQQQYHQYQIVGRRVPTEADPAPQVYRMKLWALDASKARSKFWYFLSRLRKVKKTNGQVIACNEIFEKDDTKVKNYGVWIRYQSRVGFHNAYKEYRETTMNAAVDALYTEMASRHRVRSHALQIIKIAEVANEDVRRESTRQFLEDDVSFPVVRKTLRHDSKSQKTTFKYQRPNFAIL